MRPARAAAATRPGVHRLTGAEAIRITAITAPDFAGADRLAVIRIWRRGNAAEVFIALRQHLPRRESLGPPAPRRPPAQP